MAKTTSKKFDLLGSTDCKCKRTTDKPGYIIFSNCECSTDNPRIKNVKIKSLFVWK